jgi:hypothetical protein
LDSGSHLYEMHPNLSPARKEALKPPFYPRDEGLVFWGFDVTKNTFQTSSENQMQTVIFKRVISQLNTVDLHFVFHVQLRTHWNKDLL